MQQLVSDSRPSSPALATPDKQANKRRSNHFALFSTIAICLLPALVLYLVFVLLPVGQAAYYSLYRWNGLDPLVHFVGLNNYIRIITTDHVFLKAVTNNVTIVALSLLLQLPFSLVLAMMIGRKLRGRTFFRTVFFLPYVLSDVVTAVIWMFIYRPDGGFLTAFLQAVFPNSQPPAFLANPNTVLFAIFVAMIWKYFGLHLVLYLTGIQNIPDELIEAARIDGASGVQIARYVTMPLLGSTIRLSVLLSALGSLQYFDLIWIISDGGPVNASETMATYLVHSGFKQFALGYGSAIGVVMFILCFGFALLYQRIVMREDLAGSVTSSR